MQRADHCIYKNRVLKAAAPAGIETNIRCTGHVFYTACQNNISHSGFDHGSAAENGFHTRNTYAIDGYSGHRFRNTGQKSCYPGCVQGIAVFNATTESDIIDDSRVYSGTPDGLFHDDSRNAGSYHVL